MTPPFALPSASRRRALPAIVGALLLACSTLVAACGSTSSPAPSASGPGGTAANSPTPTGIDAPDVSPTPITTITKLTVGLGYIPSVQFAPFYLAQKAGYYRDAGLDVTFQNGHDDDLINLVGQGTMDIGLADGTSLIPAVSQGIPVRYVATIYAQFPNIVLTKASSSISTVADLKGKKIGTPGKYGSGWIMLQALLQSADLTTSDVDVALYPDYGQATALEQGAVDAATGFINNEPVVLAKAGTPTTTLTVDEIVPLPGNGLITSTDTLARKHDALSGFVDATLRAMDEITADPNVGLDASIAAVPDLGKDKPLQLAILNATIGMWSSDYTNANGTGAIDKGAWQQTVTFMAGLPGSPITGTPPTVDQLVDDSLIAP